MPRDLETICLKAMGKEPAWRYPTAADLADDLHRFLDNRPILARHASPPEQLYRWCRRNPAMALVSGLAGAAALSFISLLIAFAVHKAQSVQTLTRLSASLALDHGLSQCEKGETPTGILWLARALQLAPSEATDLQHVIRLNLSSWNHESAMLKEFVPGENESDIFGLAPDCAALVTVSEQHLVHIRDLLAEGFPTLTFDCQIPVSSAALSGSGGLLVTGHADATARLWDRATGEPRGSPFKHPKEVVAVSLSLDGSKLATGSRDHMVRIWRVSDGSLIGVPLGVPAPIQAISFSPEADLLMTSCLDGKVMVWDLTSGKKRFEIGDTAAVWSASFSPDGKRLATASIDRTARIRDVSNGELIGSPMVHQEQVRTVTFSADGCLLVTASSDKTARLWNAATSKPIGPGLLHTTRVVAAAFRPDRKSFISVGTDGAIRRWQLAGDEVGRLLKHSGDIACLAVSHDGSRVVTASGAGAKTLEARIWDVHSGRLLAAPIALADSAVSCAFDRSDQSLLISLQVGTVLLVDPATGQVRQTIRERDMLSAAIFCARDTLICTGTIRGDVRLWDAATGKATEPSLSLGSAITSLCSSPASNLILAGTEDGTVGVWNTKTGEIHQERRHQAEVMSLCFGANDDTVISGSWDHTACIHQARAGNRCSHHLSETRRSGHDLSNQF